MGVRYEERSADDREFGTFKFVFYGEGRVEAAMRTSERHEMSEKVSVCETGMPCAESSESNFEVTGRLIRWIPGMRRPFEILRDFFSQCETQGKWMNFFINRKRSEFVGRYENEALGRSRVFWLLYQHSHCRGMPMCPEAQMNVKGCDWRRR